MAIVAVAGDATTTTAVALASAWPSDDRTLLVEADPSGGDLAAWFDMPVTPSLSTVVTSVRDGLFADIESQCRVSSAGLALLPAPARVAEASQAVRESARHVVSVMAATPSPVTIADVGSLSASPASHPFVAAAAATIIVHRQATQSPAAAAVRLQRLADELDGFTALPTTPIVAVVGATPFSLDEIETFLADAVSAVPVIGLPVDELAAAVLAGRTGVSAKRLARLPLLKASRDLAIVAQRTLDRAAAGWTGVGSWEAAR